MGTETVFQWHPPLTAFPLALLVSVFTLELWCVIFRTERFRGAITVNLVLASIGVVAAFFSGYQASEFADATFKVPDEAISRHHFYGRLLLIGLVPCCATYWAAAVATHGKVIFQTIYRLLLIILVGLVVVTGWLGGGLVFEHGAGVRAQIVKGSM